LRTVVVLSLHQSSAKGRGKPPLPGFWQFINGKMGKHPAKTSPWYRVFVLA
jgi:hypothetical protein